MRIRSLRVCVFINPTDPTFSAWTILAYKYRLGLFEQKEKRSTMFTDVKNLLKSIKR